jgi:hypothetical protein
MAKKPNKGNKKEQAEGGVLAFSKKSTAAIKLGLENLFYAPNTLPAQLQTHFLAGITKNAPMAIPFDDDDSYETRLTFVLLFGALLAGLNVSGASIEEGTKALRAAEKCGVVADIPRPDILKLSHGDAFIEIKTLKATGVPS